MDSGKSDSGGPFVLVRVRSNFACLLHWVLFTAVTVLVVTGFYIAYPQLYYGQGEAWSAYAMGDVRTYHFIAAWTLVIGAVVRMYLAFTPQHNHDIKQFLPTPRNIVNAIKLAKYFLTLRGEHGHFRFINPLGGIGIFFMAIFFLIQAITGLALYLEGADQGVWFFALFIGDRTESFFGGQQGVRLAHHLVMYLLVVVILIHVYMQIWKASLFSESDISSIIAGYKMFPISEIGHFDDYYGLRLNEPPPGQKEMEKASKTDIECLENGG